MKLDYGWIDLLISTVTYARCNGELFGVQYFDLITVDGANEQDHRESIVNEYGITAGRYEILKEATRHITPNSVASGDDELLILKFSELVDKNIINGVAITGLSSYQLSDRSGKLLPKGLEIIRDIGREYKLVPV